MFAKVLLVSLRAPGGETPVPRAWLDRFFMRDFTGCGVFDETLVVGDGLLEAGSAVGCEDVRDRFEAWLLGRKMIASGVRLCVTPALRSSSGAEPDR